LAWLQVQVRQMKKTKLFSLSLLGSVLVHIGIILLLAASGYLAFKQPSGKIIYVEAVNLAPLAVTAGHKGIITKSAGKINEGTAEYHPSTPINTSVGTYEPTTNKSVNSAIPNATSNDVSDVSSSGSTNLRGQISSEGNGSNGSSVGNGQGAKQGGNEIGNGRNVPGDEDRSASASGNNSGHYDEAAVEREIEGTVTVRGLLNANGSVTNVFVIASSGNGTIDNMGIRDMSNGSYRPARDKNGKPTASYITKSFTYRLN